MAEIGWNLGQRRLPETVADAARPVVPDKAVAGIGEQQRRRGDARQRRLHIAVEWRADVMRTVGGMAQYERVGVPGGKRARRRFEFGGKIARRQAVDMAA